MSFSFQCPSTRGIFFLHLRHFWGLKCYTLQMKCSYFCLQCDTGRVTMFPPRSERFQCQTYWASLHRCDIASCQHAKKKPTAPFQGLIIDWTLFLFPSDNQYKDILLALKRSANPGREIQEWWIVDQPSVSSVPLQGEASPTVQREAGLQLFVFSDKVSPPSLGFLAGYG